jgi:hypothetical protein
MTIDDDGHVVAVISHDYHALYHYCSTLSLVQHVRIRPL